ncbi:MAG: DUF664 domain-containing protein, partial [Ferruginibacter sp.]|nr:DUF664 domain-containing protein [Ferruginibacter sp.]
MTSPPAASRRNFIRNTVLLSTSLGTLPFLQQGLQAHPTPPEEGLHIIGPKAGFSPQVGTLVSMMNWMRATVLRSVTKLSTPDLDHLLDANANSIGAMLLHLAATETFYQANTFEGRGDFNEAEKKQFGAAMSLGDEGRKVIKGHDLNYYLDQLKEVREKTLAEFKNRDDKWLMTVDPKFFGDQPT